MLYLIALCGGFILWLVVCAAASSSGTSPSIFNSNFSSHLNVTKSSSPNGRCYIVQDTVDVGYWADYQNLTRYYSEIHKTIISVTQYLDTIVTASTTPSVIVSPINFTSTILSNQASGPFDSQRCHGPLKTQTREFNGSVTAFHEKIIASPTAFYIYSSVNVINVPPAATTDPRFQNATDAYDNCGLPYKANRDLGYYFLSSPPTGLSNTLSGPALITAQISFSTPFVHIPNLPESVDLAANLGYIPQDLIDWMLQNPTYISRYPSLDACLPNGPPVTTQVYPKCFVQKVAEASILTTSSTTTITAPGCFHPGACPQVAMPTATTEAMAVASTTDSNDVRKGVPLAATPPVHSTLTESALHTQQSKQAMPAAFPNVVAASPANTSPVIEAITIESPANPPSNVKNALPASKGPDQRLGNSPSNTEIGSGAKAGPGQNPESSPSNADSSSRAAAGPVQNDGNLPSNPNEFVPENLSQPHQALQTSNNNPSPPVVSPNTQGFGHMIAKAMGMGPPATTAAPGETPEGITSYTVSLAPSASAVVINGITSSILQNSVMSTAGAPVGNLNSHPDTLSSFPVLIFDGQNVTPGAPAVTILGTRVSVAPSASQIVVAGSTIPLSPGQIPVVTIGSQLITASAAPQYVPASQTLVSSAPAITISGASIGLAAEDSPMFISGNTGILQTTNGAQPILTIGSQTYTANANGAYVIGGQTLMPGAPAVTVSGTPISLAPGASDIVVGGSTEFLYHTNDASLPPITIGFQTYTASPSGRYVIGNQTLIPGQSAIVIPGITGAASPTAYTVDGQVVTPNPTAFSIGGTVIAAGGPGVTVAGTPVALEASGVLEVGNQTILLKPTNTTAQPPPLGFTGDASRGGGRWPLVGLILSSTMLVVL